MIDLQPDQESFDAVARALAAESDGRRLRQDLAGEIRDAVEPAVAELRGRILAMHSSGLPHQGEPLRAAVAAAIQVDVRFSGKATGVRIKVTKHSMPRRFWNAPKRLNARSFRHKVYGRETTWVSQVGAPGWFDKPLSSKDRVQRGVERAMEKMANRIARRG